MGMSLREGEAALEKAATNNKAKISSHVIWNFWFLVLHMQASIAYKSLINTCSYTAYSKSWPAASEDLINKPLTNIQILNFIASTWAKSFLILHVWKAAAYSFVVKLVGMSDFFSNRRTCKAQSSLAVTKYWQLFRTHTSSASSSKQTNGNKSRTASYQDAIVQTDVHALPALITAQRNLFFNYKNHFHWKSLKAIQTFYPDNLIRDWSNSSAQHPGILKALNCLKRLQWSAGLHQTDHCRLILGIKSSLFVSPYVMICYRA